MSTPVNPATLADWRRLTERSTRAVIGFLNTVPEDEDDAKLVRAIYDADVTNMADYAEALERRDTAWLEALVTAD